MSPTTEAGIIAAVVVFILLLVALVGWILLRRSRTKQENSQNVQRSSFKHKLASWASSAFTKRRTYSMPGQRPTEERHSSLPASALQILRRNGGDEPDRRTSVRSVMTLPSYTPDARPTEKILGREGDRGGIDTVVEFPETNEEEEARREDEMESLYQIRVARRQERFEREERRRLRREARARGDTAALEELRIQSQRRTAAAGANPGASASATTLLQEHNTRERGRRVSEVNYMSLGVARHDGSRVRANSNESDRPLLTDSASMGHGRHGSQARSFRLAHRLNQSTTSLPQQTPDYSDDERGSSEFDFGPTAGDSARPSLSRGRSRGASLSVSMRPSFDLGNRPVPEIEPPQYDESIVEHRTSEPLPAEAPPYESPVQTDAPRLAALAPLPEIQVTPFSPVVDRHEAESV